MKNYLLIGILCATIIQPVAALANDNWKLVTKKQGVEIFTQEVEGSKLKAFKGTIEIEVSKRILMDIVSDVDSWKNWVPDVVESKTIDRTEEFQTYYVKSDLPWPVRDRDGAYRFDYVVDESMATVTYKVSAVPEAMPLDERTIRIPKANGEWKFTEVTPQTTKISYQMHVDPGGSLPSWLVNSSVIDTPLKTLTNLMVYAEDKALEK